MNDVTDEHYRRLATRYDENWNYSPDFVRKFSGKVVSILQLTGKDLIADIGCGTGLYTSEIDRQVQPTTPMICIDPSASMLEQISTDSRFSIVLGSAEQVAKKKVLLPVDKIDVIFIKEAIHHVDNQAETIQGLCELLRPGGRFLIAMLPTTIAYPLFDDALRRFEARQPDPRQIQVFLENAGLTAQTTIVELEVKIPKSRYLSMVKNRYMSLLSTFTDKEIADGVQEIDHRFQTDTLNFPDRFAFVHGRVSDAQ